MGLAPHPPWGGLLTHMRRGDATRPVTRRRAPKGPTSSIMKLSEPEPLQFAAARARS